MRWEGFVQFFIKAQIVEGPNYSPSTLALQTYPDKQEFVHWLVPLEQNHRRLQCSTKEWAPRASTLSCASGQEWVRVPASFQDHLVSL